MAKFDEFRRSCAINKQNGAVVKYVILNQKTYIDELGKEVEAGNVVIQDLYGRTEVLTKDEFNRLFDDFDEKFGWFEFADELNTVVYLKNVANSLLAVKLGTADNGKSGWLEFVFPNNTITLAYRNYKTAEKDLISFRRMISLIKKTWVRK